MKNEVLIEWPNGEISIAEIGDDWITAANNAGVIIPLGCLSGSCGACEIEVNGKIVRACVGKIKSIRGNKYVVDFANDPYW